MIKRINNNFEDERIESVLILGPNESGALSSLLYAIHNGEIDLVGKIAPNHIADLKEIYEQGWLP